MKNKHHHKHILLSALALLGMAITSPAAVIVSDGFTYPDGALAGNNGGTGFSAAWTGDGNVVSGVVVGSNPSFRTLATPLPSSGTIWVSFKWGLDSGDSPPDGVYGGLTFFQDGTERSLIGDTWAAGVWGINANGDGNNAVHSTVSDVGIKTAVAKITLGADATSSIDLWVGANAVDAVDVSGPPLVTKGGLTLAGVNTIRIGSGFQGSSFDNLVIATTPAEVGAVGQWFFFDDGTAQGWVSTRTSSTADGPTNFVISSTELPSYMPPPPSGSYSVDPSPFADRDNAHDTLVFSSPVFRLDTSKPANYGISVYLLGGTGGSATPATLATLPATAAGDGFMGVALRRVSDGTYLLTTKRTSPGQDAWEKCGWDAATIAAAVSGDAPGTTYQIDLIDQFAGGWGWVAMDSVAIGAYLPPASDYNSWGGPYGLTAGSEGGDLDGDGLTNFQEYAFGLIPNSSSSVNPITVPLDKATKKFTYTRRKQAFTGMSYSVWYSGDLQSWTKDTGTTEGTPVPNGDVETVEITLSSLPGNPLPDKLFIQVRAQ